MYAIEFLANIQDDSIKIPAEYRHRLHQRVRVILLSEEQESRATEALSILDVINQAPGQRVFRSAEEVDRYLEDERAAWDR